jgi:hypothetical protein
MTPFWEDLSSGSVVDLESPDRRRTLGKVPVSNGGLMLPPPLKKNVVGQKIQCLRAGVMHNSKSSEPSDNENVTKTVTGAGPQELPMVSNDRQQQGERSKTPNFFEPDDLSKINYIRKRKRD